MIKIGLQELIKRLSPDLKSQLEQAAGMCVNRSHYSIEIEHWFYVILDNTALLADALQQVAMPSTPLLTKLDQELALLTAGNNSTPSLAPSLVNLIKQAWLIASVDLQQHEINAYHLLLVLKQYLDQHQYHGALSQWLEALSTEWLVEHAKQQSAQMSAPAIAGNNLAGNNTPALDKYTQNITALAREGKLDPVIGRGDEIRKAIDILCRRRQNSPILVGDPGVGKTAIVEGLAQQIVAANVPPALADVEVRSLDLTLLQAGASIKGEFENRLKDVLNEIRASAQPIIVFIDEAHTLIGAGGVAGQNDAANILKPALARGEFRSIAATTWAEYKQYFESDAALTRRFQVIAIAEPSALQAQQILRALQSTLEQHHGVRIKQDALEAAVSYAIRYLPERKLPDKAISLLDTACSRIALSQSAEPRQLEQIKEELAHLAQEAKAFGHETALWALDDLNAEGRQQREAQLREELQTLTAQLNQERDAVTYINQLQAEREQQLLAEPATASSDNLILKNEIEKLEQIQGESPLVQVFVTKQTIAEVVSLWTGIPAGNIVKQEVERLTQLETLLGERVIGQPAPLQAIAEAIRIARTGLTDPRKPVGVFLMCGPSGVGKTETALALSDILYGGEQHIISINMTEFKEPHKVSMLLGSPAGYVGYGKGGVLTEAVRKNPYAVLLLDEMEKAHPSVQDIFYQIFDKGHIADSEGRNIDFRHCIIIMTSNAADQAVVDAHDKFGQEINLTCEAIAPALQHYFKPAFLGRTTIIPYFPLDTGSLTAIAHLAFKRIAKQVKNQYGADFSYSAEVIAHLISMNFSPQIGARAIEQLINRKIMPLLAEKCLAMLCAEIKISKIDIQITDNEFDIQLG